MVNLDGAYPQGIEASLLPAFSSSDNARSDDRARQATAISLDLYAALRQGLQGFAPCGWCRSATGWLNLPWLVVKAALLLYTSKYPLVFCCILDMAF